MKLNLGANDRHVEGFISVDLHPPADQIAEPWPWSDSSVDEVLDLHPPAYQIADLSQPWPWPDSSVDEVLAYSVFEHLPDKLHTMRELHRVLKPGGIARLQLPHATMGDGGHCDPTHCSYWTASDFEYYAPGVAEYERFHASYGLPAFNVLNLDERGHIRVTKYGRKFGGTVYEFDVVLEAVK